MSWTEYSKPWLNVKVEDEIIERLEAVNLSDAIQETEMVYHKNCCTTFTSLLHLGRMKKNFDAKKSPCADDKASTSSKNQTLRSNMETLDSD